MRASVDKTQLGRAGELAMALYAMVSSDGELELFTPVADDDHVDATAARRGGVPAIAIQVKTASGLDRRVGRGKGRLSERACARTPSFPLCRATARFSRDRSRLDSAEPRLQPTGVQAHRRG